MSPEAVLTDLTRQLPQLTPELRKAAQHVLENPNEIGISSVRQIASAAGVKPNSLVRMARAVGFEGFEDFRQPFREDIKAGRDSFPDRARWLQRIGRGGKMGGLYAEMAAASLDNIQDSFAAADAGRLADAATAIVAAKKTFVLGVGIAHAYARNFAYLADMALDTVVAIPRDGSLPIDDLARAEAGDVLLAMTFKPFRREILEAADHARSRGVTVIGLSDSPASPLLGASDHGFLIATDTPQFFTSTVALAAFLETLMAFVIAEAEPDVIANIEAFHTRREALGIYWTGED
jgi:DNA-binding MurR/RpiR family transcriptional regulator